MIQATKFANSLISFLVVETILVVVIPVMWFFPSVVIYHPTEIPDISVGIHLLYF